MTSSRRWLWRGVTLLFLLGVGLLLWHQFRQLDWPEIFAALRAYPLSQLALAMVFVVAGHLVYACFDLLGRHHTGHALRTGTVLSRVLVCYAFNINLSALLGGMALRFRLYARCGLPGDTIAQVIALSVTTNWLGYMLLLGGLFVFGQPPLPEHWALAGSLQRILGGVLLCVPILVWLAGFRWQGHVWTWRQHRFRLPGAGLIAVQLLLGSLNWMLMAMVLYILLPEGAHYATVLAVLLASSLAGLVSRVPAGLGVLEATALALLQHAYSHAELMAALIGFRVCYFLVPLSGAALLYPWLELGQGRRVSPAHSQKRHQRRSSSGSSPS